MLLKKWTICLCYSFAIMPMRWYLLMGLVNQVSLLSDTSEWNFVCSGSLNESLLKGMLSWIPSLKTGELKSLGWSFFWRLCDGTSEIGVWAFETVRIISLTWQLRASRAFGYSQWFKSPSFDYRALCCLLPLWLILSDFPVISWSSFLRSHPSPSVHREYFSVTAKLELGWTRLNTKFLYF